MADIKISAKSREITTKGAVNQMRRDGIVPAVFYTKDAEPIHLSVPEISLKPIVFTSERHLITLQREGEEELACILKNVQFDPITDRIIHVDFYGVTFGQTLQLQIPIQIVGSAIGVKSGGYLQVALLKLDIECMPKNIPDHITVDVSKLEIGDSIHAEDIKIENVTVITPADVLIASCNVPKGGDEEEDEEESEEEITEPEVINQGKSEE